MHRGIHTIKSGFSTDWDQFASNPRRYGMDNGDFEVNMRILDIQLMTGVDPGQLDMGNSTIFFVVSTTAEGAIPTDGTSLEHQAYQHRFDDHDQIAWGNVEAQFGPNTIIDPGHVIPGDIYVNAWMIATGGGPVQLTSPLSYIITMAQVENTGDEGLLYSVKQAGQS